LTKKALRDKEIPVGWVAQSVEQGTENPRVGSSILSPATTINNETKAASRQPFSFAALPRPSKFPAEDRIVPQSIYQKNCSGYFP
jgi:hypothetical protein